MTLAGYQIRTADFSAFRHPVGFGPRTGAPGRVLWSVSDFVAVLADGMEYRCKLTGKAKRRDTESLAPVVGDLVEFEEIGPGEGIITRILPRESVFSRRMPGPRGTWREQVLAANLTAVLVVFAAAEPAPHPRGLDRYLVIAEEHELSALIVANKCDLTGDDGARAIFGVYERAGYPVWYTSVRRGTGLDGLRERLANEVTIVTGPSGVGKSSLLNALVPDFHQQTGEISRALHKGRHTTVVGTLHPLAGGGWVADTPGLREIGPYDLPAVDLDYCYREFRPFLGGCRWNDCLHHAEAACAVRAAVERGAIDPARYDSYLRLLAELRE